MSKREAIVVFAVMLGVIGLCWYLQEFVAKGTDAERVFTRADVERIVREERALR